MGRAGGGGRGVRVLAVVVLILFAGGCASTPAPVPGSPGQASGSAGWAKYVGDFESGYFERSPTFAVQQGRHEYDGRLPDWSAAGIRAGAQWLHQQRTRAEMFVDEELSADQRFERQYLLSRINEDLFWLERAEQPFTNPSFYEAYSGPCYRSCKTGLELRRSVVDQDR